MNKNFVKNMLAVVLGICLLIMLFSLASLIMEAALSKDLIEMGSSSVYETVYFIKWSATGLACLLVPTLASAAFAYFGNNKFLPVIAAVMFFFVAASAFGFIAKVREIAGTGATAYAAATAYMQELLQLAVPAVLAGVYFIINAVKAFSVKQNNEVTKGEAQNEEIA
ncbi:MAG: hypothetical protein K2L67_03380 [Clostridia bacterium]|nr:hypothetical protein [Clostridia bacterium]